MARAPEGRQETRSVSRAVALRGKVSALPWNEPLMEPTQGDHGGIHVPSADTRGAAFDSQKAEAFAGRMLRALNDGALCLMVSIGHRAGLFDAMRDQAPATSAEIAERAGLDERYVREWLGAMVTSGVATVDGQSTRYSLPPEHAAYLTRAAAADNIGVFAQYIPLLGNVEDHILA